MFYYYSRKRVTSGCCLTQTIGGGGVGDIAANWAPLYRSGFVSFHRCLYMIADDVIDELYIMKDKILYH